MWPDFHGRRFLTTIGALGGVLALGVVLYTPGGELPDQQTRRATSLRETARIGCGPAALLAAVSASDAEAALRLREILRDEIPAVGAFSSFHDLANWAERVGFEAVGLEVEPLALARVSLPAIGHLRPGHFVVIHSVSETHVVVSEPGARSYSMTRAGFEQIFSGNVLCLQRRSTPTG